MSAANSGKSTRKRGRVENLEPWKWKPGQSGNPTGRPRSAHLSAAYRQILEQPFPGDPDGRTWAQVIAQRLADAAANGDTTAAKEIADRVEGKAVSSLEVSGGLGLRNDSVDPQAAERMRQDPDGALASIAAAEILNAIRYPHEEGFVDRLLADGTVRAGLRLLIERAEGQKGPPLLTTTLPADQARGASEDGRKSRG